MKRPFNVYLVAFWCLFALLAHLNGVAKGLKEGLSHVEISPEMGQSAFAVSGILIIWHIVKLIQLKAFNRWFSIAVFALWTVELLRHLISIVPKLEHYGGYAVGTLSFCLLNVACVWYLGRKTFRQFAVEFVVQRDKEKHSRMMQEAAQKRMQDEIRKTKS